jgi:nitrite reductase/ring-hydroxylating ferredoxin subunit
MDSLIPPRLIPPRLIPPRLRVLCRLDDIPDGGAKGFPAATLGSAGLFAVRQGDRAFVYVNACPHIGISLDWLPDRFLSADGRLIVCSTHGAEFRIADGVCLRGPCHGDALEAVPVTIDANRTLMVAEGAGL